MLAEREDSLVQGLISGVAVFRWLAWAWLAAMVVISRKELTDPRARGWIAYLLAAAALAVTSGITVLLRTAPDRLLTLPVVAVEVAVGCALGIGDQLAFNGVSHPQMLGSIWPLAGIISAGKASQVMRGMSRSELARAIRRPVSHRPRSHPPRTPSLR